MGLPLNLLELDQSALYEELEGVAHHFVSQGEGLIRFLVEKVGAFAVGVKVGGGHEDKVRFLELVLGLEGLLEDGRGEKVAHLEADESLASARGGCGDVGLDAGVRGVVELEDGLALDVDSFDECGPCSKYMATALFHRRGCSEEWEGASLGREVERFWRCGSIGILRSA